MRRPLHEQIPSCCKASGKAGSLDQKAEYFIVKVCVPVPSKAHISGGIMANFTEADEPPFCAPREWLRVEVRVGDCFESLAEV